MKKLLLFITILLSIAAKAQDTPEIITNNFFKRYEKNPSEAINYIFSTNHYFSKQQTTDFTKKINDAIKVLGEYCGYELIQKENIGNSFVLLNHIIKYERQPIKFSFIFYKPKDTWVLYNFNFNGELETELEAAAKINLLIK